MADIIPPEPPVNINQRNINRDTQQEYIVPIAKTPKWQMYVWAGCAGILSLELFGLTILAYMRTTEITAIVSQTNLQDGAFILAGLGMSAFSLIRILAILVGSAIIFGGLSISFFSSERASNVKLNGSEKLPLSAHIASHSPGVMGILVGGIIIICALFAPTSFNYQQPVTFQYSGSNAQAVTQDTQPSAMTPEELRESLRQRSSK